MWLVLLPAVWSRYETFFYCFDYFRAINHGDEIKSVLGVLDLFLYFALSSQ